MRETNITKKEYSPYGYKDGLKDGVPVGMAYFFVSIGFGIIAVNYGVPALFTVFISLSNMTSAGQVAGVGIMGECTVLAVSAVEMILTQLVINLRYSLMAISLSQKLDSSFRWPIRLIAAFCITDETFAVSSGKKGIIGFKYWVGLCTLPIAGWTSGTAVGALAASWMPQEIALIFSIGIYGMFLGIVLPKAVKSRGVMLCVLVAAALNCILYYVPCFSFISFGFSVIICSLASSAIAAFLIPAEGKEDAHDDH